MNQEFNYVEEIVMFLCCINSESSLNFCKQYHLKMFEEYVVFHDCQLTLLLLISQNSVLGSASNLLLQSPAHLPLPQQQLMKIENVQANSVRSSL